MKLPAWMPAALALLAAAAYANSFAGAFVLDDEGSILRNPTIRSLWAWPGPLAPPRGGGLTVEGRPLLNLSFALNYAAGGEAPWGYHLVNLLIHAGAGLALFGIVRRTLGASLAAFAIAALWLAHPLQTESVTYVAQRAESLMGLCYLLTLYGFVRGVAGLVEAGASGVNAPGYKVGWLSLSVLCCLFGMATKEVMVSAPIIVLLYDRAFVAGSFARAWRLRRGYYLALAATWLLLGALVWRSGSRGGTSGLGSGVSPFVYWATQPGAIARYLGLVVWPHPLVFDYGTEWTASPAAVLLPAAFLLWLVVLVALALRRCPRAAFLGFFFLAILAPTSLVPGNRQTMAEHRMYLASAAVIAALVLGLRRLAARRGLGPRVSAPAAAGAMLLCLGLTLQRNRAYASPLALYADTVARRPENSWARNNLGFALGQAGREDEAAAQFREAIRLKPDLPDAHYNLGLLLGRAGRGDEAVREYEEALRLNPRYRDARFNLAVALERIGRQDDAVAQFQALVAAEPAYVDARVGYGDALLRAGRMPGAVEQFTEAVRLRPDLAEPRYNLGLLLLGSGRGAEGVAQLREALRLKPEFAPGHYTLGRALAQSGDMAGARAELEAAVRLRPRDPEAQLDLGNVLLALGRPAEAAARYEAALGLRPGYPEAERNLAYVRGLGAR